MDAALVLARCQRHTASFPIDVGLDSDHLRVIKRQFFAFQRIPDTPVDHVSNLSHLAKLFLELGIGFRVGIGRVGVAHVTGDADGSAEQFRAVKDARTLHDKFLCLPFPG